MKSLRHSLTLLTLATLSAQAVAAEAPPAPATPESAQGGLVMRAWEVGLSHARLTRGLPPWRESYLRGEWQTAGKADVYAGLRTTERYRQDDREAHLGAVLPVHAAHQLQFEFGASDTHRVLPVRYGALHWYHQPGGGWSLGGGLRHSSYDSGSSRVFDFGVDRYVAAERFSYTLFAGGPLGSTLNASHRLQWAHYYGDTDWIGLSVLRGKEAEYARDTGLLTSRVSGASLSGRHGLSARWALLWSFEQHRQGDLHTRRGAQLGLRHTF